MTETSSAEMEAAVASLRFGSFEGPETEAPTTVTARTSANTKYLIHPGQRQRPGLRVLGNRDFLAGYRDLNSVETVAHVYPARSTEIVRPGSQTARSHRSRAVRQTRRIS